MHSLITIFTIRFAPLFRSGRMYLYSVLAAILLLASQSFLNAQQLLIPEGKKALESMAQCYATGYDRLTPLLDGIGYHSEEKMRDWPVIYRLTAVVLMANDERKCMALLAQHMAQEYGSLKEDSYLEPYLQGPEVLPGEVNWPKTEKPASLESHTSTGTKEIEWYEREAQSEVRDFLLSASNYFEGKALGEPITILKNNLNLSFDVIFHIVMKSNSTWDAISDGIECASKNGTEAKALIGNLAFELCKYYESANHIPEIKAALQWQSNKIPEWKSIPINQPDPSGKGHNIDEIASRIYLDSTKLGIEIIPDIRSSSVKIVISPAYYEKATPPDFYRNYVQKLMKISGKDILSQVYNIETEMRRELNGLSTQTKQDPYIRFGRN